MQDNTTKEIYQATFAKPGETPPIITGIDELPGIINENKLVVYPNPASDKMQVMLNTSSVYHWKIYDNFGREVLKGKTNHTKNFPINLESLAGGLYILQLENKDQQFYSARFSVIR